MGMYRTSLRLVVVLASTLALGGCETANVVDKMSDVLIDFNPFGTGKKPLPGDRKPVFPEGVPGVTQGVPPEMMKGAAQQDVAAPEPQKEAAAVEPEKPKAKPKPKPQKQAKAKPAPAAETSAPAQQAPQNDGWPAPPPPQQQAAPWPAPPQNQAPAPWPSQQ